MRRIVLNSLTLCIALTLVSLTAKSQADRFAYLISDHNKDGIGWNMLRIIHTQTGEYSDIVLNGTDKNIPVYDASSGAAYAPADARLASLLQQPFGTGVAAIAYDGRSKKLWFTPMFLDQLRYIDLKSMKVYAVTGSPFSGNGNLQQDEGKIITRMALLPNGDGYAISNDGNSLVRFTTGKNVKTEILGGLVDDPENGNISIHNRCTSYGGDMIADDEGRLYIVSARNFVFRVNPETRVASYLGTIKGMPADFTTNGLVVNEEGKLLAGSAMYHKSWFVVNTESWTAEPYEIGGGAYRSSDLANSNILQTRSKRSPDLVLSENPGPVSLISVYPNPVTTRNFTLEFNKLEAGDYNIDITDVTGRLVLQRRINLTGAMQVEKIQLGAEAQGMYMIRVTDRNSKSIFTQKMVIN